MTGSVCAWRLARYGHRVDVFDLGGRFPGGRSSTRRVPEFPGMQFDHGAQFFTAVRPEVQPLISELLTAGKLHAWEPKLVEINAMSGTITSKGSSQASGFFDSLLSPPMYVGQPSMDAICCHLTASSGVNLKLATKPGLDTGPATIRWPP